MIGRALVFRGTPLGRKFRGYVASAAFVLALVSFAPGGSAATVGYFCANCVDAESARQQALQYAAPLICNSDDVFFDPSTPLVCRSDDRRVVLGNHLTGQVFAFDVTRGDTMPWAASAIVSPLDSAGQYAYGQVIGLRNDWDRFMSAGIVMSAAAAPTSTKSTCPTGTALDFALNPMGQFSMEEMITAEVSQNIDAYREQSPWYRSGFGVGVTVFGTGASLQFPDDETGIPVFSVEFPISEISNPNFQDMLVYELELRGVASSGQPILEISLVPGASRIIGARMDLVLAGEVDITDECVLDKLGSLDDGGSDSFRLGGLTVDPALSFGFGGGSGGPSGGGSGGMCTFDFYTNNRYQFSFRAPCDAVDDGADDDEEEDG